MGVQLFTNNASSTLAGALTNVATSFSVSAGQGALFPAITGSDYFYVTLVDGSANKEIVKVTARSTDTFTVTRAQEGTSARSFSGGDVVELRPTAAAMTNFVQKTGSTLTLDDANFTLQDNSDQTKQAQFQLSGITTGTTRTYTVPNASVTLAGLSLAQSWTAAQTFDNSNLKMLGSSTGATTFSSANTGASNYTVTFPAETMTVGFRNVPAVGTKTGSYTLAVGDVGKYVQLGSGGAITIPDATFAEGDVVSIVNNTASTATITCTITTAYISGTDSDKATMTLAARGICTIFFLSGTVCVVNGSVT